MKALDFFCGGGGMTHGFRAAGIRVIAGIDIDLSCKETYEFNNAGSAFLHADIKTLSPNHLSNKFGIKKNDDNLVFIGCSPCQYWTLIKTDKTQAEKSKNLLGDFLRFIDYFRPGFVVIENVPGLFFKPDSPLQIFLDWLKDNSYNSVDFKVIKVLDYGVPQSRKRFVLIASRTKRVEFPPAVENKRLTVREFIGNKRLFPVVPAGYRDESDFCHTVSGLSKICQERLKLTPKNGGSRHAWQDTRIQLDVYQRKRNDKSFGFGDVYGRLSWDRPSSTITTKFYGISHGRFAHPEQNRGISIREAATLQTFPLSYVFKEKSISGKARLIGNAVPPELAKRIALSIVNANMETAPREEQIVLNQCAP